MKLLRPPASRAFRVPRRPGPALAAIQTMFPSTREIGADFHCIFGTDNPNDLCQITGRRIHPNLRPYLLDGGSGYTVAPAVAIANGAKARAVLSSSAPVPLIATLTSGGAGYPSAPNITVSVTGGVYGPGGRPPRFRVISVAGGVITSFAMLDPGAGIITVPDVAFVAATGAGAVLTLALTKSVRRVDVTNGGAGYTAPPSVSLNGGVAGNNLTARAFAIINAGVVTAVYIFDGGYGYTSPPSVVFSGGGGAAAAATAVIDTNVIRCIELTDAGNQPAAPAVVLTGGNGAAANAGTLMAAGAYVRSANSITIPAGGNLDNNSQNGLLLPILDDGEQTIFLVAKIATAGTSQIVLGSATNAGSTNGGEEIRNTIGTGYTIADYNVQLTLTALPLPAGAVNGSWVLFVVSVAPVPGESVQPSSAKVQSSKLYARAGTAAALSLPSGERKALSRARMMGVGNCWQYGVAFRGALEVAEVFGYDGFMSVADIDAARARCTARMAARGIALVN